MTKHQPTPRKQVNPDVVAAYPITPQTIIVEKFSEYVANGEVDTEFVAVESEHSAMSTSVGASAAGARAFTATAANGLALMWEIVYIASSSEAANSYGVLPTGRSVDQLTSIMTTAMVWVHETVAGYRSTVRTRRRFMIRVSRLGGSLST